MSGRDARFIYTLGRFLRLGDVPGDCKPARDWVARGNEGAAMDRRRHLGNRQNLTFGQACDSKKAHNAACINIGA